MELQLGVPTAADSGQHGCVEVLGGHRASQIVWPQHQIGWRYQPVLFFFLISLFILGFFVSVLFYFSLFVCLLRHGPKLTM